MDFRNKNDKKNEKKLLCILRKSESLYLLANKILFNYIKLAKKYGLDNENLITKIKLILFNEKTNKKKYSRIASPDFKLKSDIIIKNGYDCKNDMMMCKKILNFKNYKELYLFNKKNNISLLKITSSFYMFQMDNVFFTNIIKNSKQLQNKIIKTFNTYFSTEYNFEQIDKIVNKSEGNWFYTWLLMFMDSDVKNLMHRNLNEDKDYIRKWIYKLESTKDISIIKQKNISCINEKTYNIKNDIMKGDSYMKPIFNGVWWNVMKKNKKEIIAGPSSSAVLFYNSIFNMTKILTNTYKNKVLLLCLIIADYSEIFHSLSEILQLYTKDAELTEYKLEDNDVDYVLKLIEKYKIKL